MKSILKIGLLFFYGINLLSANDFVFIPPSEFTLDPKYIALHHPVNTDQIAAQLYFDQGLTQLYAFNNDMAYWSFLNASKIDPQMPMAYWGMACALAPNILMNATPDRKKAAREAIQTAINLNNVSEIEKEYIQALASKYENNDDDDDESQSKLKYSQSLEKLSKKYLDDPDAAVFWAASLLDLQKEYWDENKQALPGILEAIKILENVMIKYPNHIGANHYYIHALDGSPYPEKALRSAERLQTLLPTAGHLLHMPSHIYLLVGDYHKAALCSEEAFAADQEYVNMYGINGSYPMDYITHNLYFLTRAYSLEERFEDAKQAADKLRNLYLPHFKHMPKMEYFAVVPLFILVRFHDWDSVLKFVKPSDNMLLANLLWHFSRAIAFINLQKNLEASKENQLFNDLKTEIFDKKLFQNENIKKMINIFGYFIDAKLAENEKRFNDSIKIFQQAVKLQNTLPYNESPVWFFSARQYLGSLFLKLKKFEEAEKVFRQDLNTAPNNSRSLFGLKESLAAQLKFYDLYWVNKSFQQAFKFSDIKLTVNNL